MSYVEQFLMCDKPSIHALKNKFLSSIISKRLIDYACGEQIFSSLIDLGLSLSQILIPSFLHPFIYVKFRHILIFPHKTFYLVHRNYRPKGKRNYQENAVGHLIISVSQFINILCIYFVIEHVTIISSSEFFVHFLGVFRKTFI